MAFAIPNVLILWRRMPPARAQWWLWRALCVTSLVLLVASAYFYQRAHERLGDLTRRLEAVQASAKPASAASAVVVDDFTRHMGAAPSTADVVQALKQVSALSGAVLVSVQSQQRPPAVDRLETLELGIQMRGTYAGLKQVLAHLVERFPYSSVSHLRVRRVSGSTEVEMNVTFLFWGKPVEAAPLAR